MDKANYHSAVSRSTLRIRRYFESRSSDPEEIADLSQETIASLLESSERYREACSFATWVYAVCRNVYSKHIYYAVRRRELDRILRDEFVDQAVSRDEKPDPIEVAVRMDALESATERLDTYDKRLYQLYYLERLSVAKVSNLLNRSEGTVKWQLYRLRRRLRDVILELNVNG
jgi:RNA polymerase sigma-70 factor, ECF subfamily